MQKSKTLITKNADRHNHATVLPEAPNPVNERPEGMSYQAYCELRKSVNATLRSRKKGFLCFLANEMLLDDKGRPYGFLWTRNLKPHGKTHIGSTRFLQLV
jgi:hypothetical protein